MMLPEAFANLVNGAIIVVDNAKRPIYSATEAAPHFPLMCRYLMPLVTEKRMIRKRSSRKSNRWESAPFKPTLSECSQRNQPSSSPCSSYPTMNLVYLAAAMPLRMPVRSKDDFDLSISSPSKSCDQSSLIDFLDAALAISEIFHKD